MLAQTGRLTTDDRLPITEFVRPGWTDSFWLHAYEHHTLLVLTAATIALGGVAMVLMGRRCLSRLADDGSVPTSPARTRRVVADGLLGWRRTLAIASVAALASLLFVSPSGVRQAHAVLVGGTVAWALLLASVVIALLRALPSDLASSDSCARCGCAMTGSGTCPECGSLYAEYGITPTGSAFRPGVGRHSGRKRSPSAAGTLGFVLVAGAVPLPATGVGVRADALRLGSETSPGMDVHAWIATVFKRKAFVRTSAVASLGYPDGVWSGPMDGEVFARDYTPGGGFPTIEPAILVLRRSHADGALEVSGSGDAPWSEATPEALAPLLAGACEVCSAPDRTRVNEAFAARLLGGFSEQAAERSPPGGFSWDLRVETSFWSWAVPVVAGVLGWFGSCGIARRARPAG